MKFLLVLTALVHAAYSGNVAVRTSNLLTPAGVTYVDGSYHAGLTAGPISYSASVAQPVYQSVAAPAVSVASQPLTVTAYAAPSPKYAAVPTVQHVPGVADVPVTRIDAQPAVIQKTVDVARPAVKTQRYEVRRPAIQKQFYDIEERVVVRPAGSAVVELEEPLSSTQTGPSVIRPTGDGVAVTSGVSVAGPPAPPPSADLPAIDINLARSAAPAVGPSLEVRTAPVGIARTAVAAPAPPVEFRTTLPAAPVPAVGIARSAVAAPAPPLEYRTALPAAPAPVPAVGIARSAVAAPAPPVEFRTALPAAPVPTVGIARSAVAAPAPPVGFARSYAAPVQPVAYSAPHSVGISSIPVKTVAVSAPIHSGVSAISAGVSGISAGPSEVSISTPAPQYPQQIVQTTPAPQYSDDSVSIDSADFNLARSSSLARSYSGPQTFTPAPEAFRSATPVRRLPTPAARSSLIVNYPNAYDLIPQSRSPAVYSGGNIQSEINQDNQQKLIQLLTARGGVSEIGYGRSGPGSYPIEAGQVRARVLSATPAPAYAAPTGERVNTRRIVVSRPIETLQEVEVAEPVTKFERVRVDEPALVKTASQDVVRVPTSVPVYGKALAPIAEAPVAAYSADWH